MNMNRLQLFATDGARVIAFICECGDGDCRETVLLTGPQFEARTADGDLVVHPGHSVTA
jgi:hypothetical protein